MKKIILLGLLSLFVLTGLGVCVSVPDRPIVFFEAEPDFTPTVADPTEALTFAYDRDRSVLLVVDDHPARGIRAIRLEGRFVDAFEALKTYGRDRLVALATSKEGAQWYRQDRLGPLTQGAWHIAFGGNFMAHADETELEQPFAFPKTVAPSASVSTVRPPLEDALLDFETELCMVFDRDIRLDADFRDAEKGVFLCADTTDRATLLRDLPADEDPFGGTGFTDAKSYDGFFSTGPYMVIPHDWKRFVDAQPMTASVDGALMQYAHGADMIFDFEEIVSYSLAQGDREYWETRDRRTKLLPGGTIPRGTALLSGTAEGVIFRPPTSLNDMLCGGGAYVCTASFAFGVSGRDYVIERFIRRHVRAGTFLQPGETVEHGSQNLGRIVIAIKAASEDAARLSRKDM